MKYNTRNNSLICYIDNQLDKPAQHYHDPFGNSPRAMLSRRRDSYLKSLHWNAKDFLKYYIRCVGSISLDTSIGDLLNLIYCTLLFPFAPFIKEFFEVRSAVKEYEREFNSK